MKTRKQKKTKQKRRPIGSNLFIRAGVSTPDDSYYRPSPPRIIESQCPGV